MNTTCTDCLIHREKCDGCDAQHSPSGDSEFHFVHTHETRGHSTRRRTSDAPRPSQYRDVAGFTAVVR